jgi:hypothetical protein
MKIRHLYTGLDSDDFLEKSKPGSEFPMTVNDDGIVSDFNFQTDFYSSFIERSLRKLKFETENFNLIMIRGRKNPKADYYIQEHFKSLTIEIPFDFYAYREIYSFKNEYPLGDKLLKPIIDQDKFSSFLTKFINIGLNKAEEQNAPIPVQELRKYINEFSDLEFENKWVYKKKNFRDSKISMILTAKLSCNSFIMNLEIKAAKTVIYDGIICKTLPSSFFYKNIIKDITLEGNVVTISSDTDQILLKKEI